VGVFIDLTLARKEKPLLNPPLGNGRTFFKTDIKNQGG